MQKTLLDLDLSITICIGSSKIYDKRDDFYFEIVISPFPGGDVLPTKDKCCAQSPSYCV